MSDQDIFFDEEDEKRAKPAAKAASKPGAKAPAKKSAAPAKATPAAPASMFDQSVSMSVAALLVVCGLLIGIIVGVLVGQARAASNVVLPTDPTASTAPANGAAAPTLTQDQMTSGQLPAGHPSVSGAASGTPAPSKNATGK